MICRERVFGEPCLMAKLYRVKLLAAQREELRAMVSKGEGKAQRMRRAQTLLLERFNKSNSHRRRTIRGHLDW